MRRGVRQRPGAERALQLSPAVAVGELRGIEAREPGDRACRVTVPGPVDEEPRSVERVRSGRDGQHERIRRIARRRVRSAALSPIGAVRVA